MKENKKETKKENHLKISFSFDSENCMNEINQKKEWLKNLETEEELDKALKNIVKNYIIF